jgi:hypothetical protein
MTDEDRILAKVYDLVHTRGFLYSSFSASPRCIVSSHYFIDLSQRLLLIYRFFFSIPHAICLREGSQGCKSSNDGFGDRRGAVKIDCGRS